MGQQQIILIILVTVIVAIVTVLSVNVLLESRQEANYDAIRQKMMDATTLAQAYYRKHEMMGGGDGSYENITLQILEVEPENEMGTFSLETGDQSVTLTAIPISGGDNIVGVIYSDRIEFVVDEEEEE
ncbi:MAG: hypothetical protein WD607_04865 [Candidatus Paceibacterota bacterium]